MNWRAPVVPKAYCPIALRLWVGGLACRQPSASVGIRPSRRGLAKQHHPARSAAGGCARAGRGGSRGILCPGHRRTPPQLSWSRVPDPSTGTYRHLDLTIGFLRKHVSGDSQGRFATTGGAGAFNTLADSRPGGHGTHRPTHGACIQWWAGDCRSCTTSRRSSGGLPSWAPARWRSPGGLAERRALVRGRALQGAPPGQYRGRLRRRSGRRRRHRSAQTARWRGWPPPCAVVGSWWTRGQRNGGKAGSRSGPQLRAGRRSPLGASRAGNGRGASGAQSGAPSPNQPAAQAPERPRRSRRPSERPDALWRPLKAGQIARRCATNGDLQRGCTQKKTLPP